MKNKILSFIANNENKLLALYSEPHPEHGPGGWFVVTGGLEENETFEQAVKREVKEETNLPIKEIFPLNCGSIYPWNNETCKEINYLSFVDANNNIILNEEHSKYKWLNLDGFINIITWDEDKELLKTILEKALNKEKHFQKLKIHK